VSTGDDLRAWREARGIATHITRLSERVDAEQVATTMGRAYAANPNFNPEAIAAIALAGGTEDLLQRLGGVVTNDMVTSNIPTSPEPAELEQSDGGWMADVMGAIREGPIGDALAPVARVIESHGGERLGDLLNNVGVLPAVRGASRYTFAALDTYTQMAQNNGSDIWRGGPGELAARAFTPYALFKTFEDNDLMDGTTASTIYQQVAEDGRIDMGSGWFPGGTVFTEQAAAAAQRRGTVNGHAWTFGRAAAQLGVDANIYDNESRWYSVVSGAIDGTIAIASDPSNYLPGVGWSDELVKGLRGGTVTRLVDALHGEGSRGLREFAEATELANRFDEAGDIARATLHRERALRAIGVDAELRGVADEDAVVRDWLNTNAGVITENGRRIVLAPEFVRFMSRKQGRRLVDYLATKTTTTADVARVHGGTRNIGPILARELAQATSPEEVLDAYARAMAHPTEEMARALKRMPHMPAFFVEDAKLWTVRNISSHTRWGHLLPEGTDLPSTDPYRFWNNLERMFDNMPMSDSFTHGRYDQGLKDDMLNKAAEALASSDPTDLYNFYNELASTFADRFVEMGFSRKQAREATHFQKWSTDMGNFLMKDLQAGVPIIDGTPGSVPALVVQMLNHGATVIDPKSYMDILHHSGRVRNTLRRAAVEEAGLDVRIAAKGMLTTVDGVQAAAEWVLARWRPVAIMRIAYLTRVIPDEIARVSTSGVMGGNFGLLSLFGALAHKGGRANLDAAGRRFSVKLDDISNAEARLTNVLDEIAQESIAGAHPQRLHDLNQTRDMIENELDALHMEAARMEVGYNKALVGRDATATFTKDPGQGFRSGQYDMATRANTEMRDKYLDGLHDRFSFYSGDPLVQVIARRNIGNQAKVTIDGVNDTLAAHVAAGRLTDDLEEKITHWLLTGQGHNLAEMRQHAYAAKGLVWDATDYDNVKAWVQEITDEVAYLTGAKGVRDPHSFTYMRDQWDEFLDGADDDLLGVLAFGKFRGNEVRQYSRRHGWVHNEEFDDHLRTWAADEWSRAPSAVRYNTGHFQGFKLTDSDEPLLRQVANAFFGAIYGRGSDYLARSPTFRYAYWRKMTHLISAIDPIDVETVVARAQKAGLPDSMVRQLRERGRLAMAGGGTPSTIDDIDGIARSAALSDVRDLLFDATKRGAFFDQMRLIMPFGDAFKEVYETWIRLMILRRGRPAKSLLKGVRGAMTAEGLGPGDIYGYDPETGEYSAYPDGKPEGLLWRDPRKGGQWMFSYPMSGAMSKLGLFGGGDYPGANMVAPASSLNIAGSLFPGLGPVVDQFVAASLPDDPRIDGIREWIFPFGEPSEPDTPAGRALDARSLIPGWIKRSTAVMADSELGGILYNFLNNVDGDPSFQSTRAHVFKQYISMLGGRMPGRSELAELDAESRKIALRIHAMRGLGQLIGPASPQPQFMVEASEGNVIATILAEELNRAEKEAIENGESRDQAVVDLLEMFGPQVWGYVAPNSESLVPGMEASDEWWDWYRTNTEAVEQYPNVGAYFGPVSPANSFSLKAYSSQMDMGLRHTQDPEGIYDDAARTLAWTAYSRVRDAMPPEDQRSLADSAALGGYKAALETHFGVQLNGAEQKNLRATQINELTQVVKDAIAGDPVARQMIASSGGTALVTYMEMRERVGGMGVSMGLTSRTSWAKAKSGAPLRGTMRALARDLSATSPEFERLYKFVLEGEMVDDAMVEGGV
jgi:hypothetical protein